MTECDRDRLIIDIIISGVIAFSIDILEHLRSSILNNCAATIKCKNFQLNDVFLAPERSKENSSASKHELNWKLLP